MPRTGRKEMKRRVPFADRKGREGRRDRGRGTGRQAGRQALFVNEESVIKGSNTFESRANNRIFSARSYSLVPSARFSIPLRSRDLEINRS